MGKGALLRTFEESRRAQAERPNMGTRSLSSGLAHRIRPLAGPVAGFSLTRWLYRLVSWNRATRKRSSPGGKQFVRGCRLLNNVKVIARIIKITLLNASNCGNVKWRKSSRQGRCTRPGQARASR